MNVVVIVLMCWIPLFGGIFALRLWSAGIPERERVAAALAWLFVTLWGAALVVATAVDYFGVQP